MLEIKHQNDVTIVAMATAMGNSENSTWQIFWLLKHFDILLEKASLYLILFKYLSVVKIRKTAKFKHVPQFIFSISKRHFNFLTFRDL